jgi:hypothetical protein
VELAGGSPGRPWQLGAVPLCPFVVLIVAAAAERPAATEQETDSKLSIAAGDSSPCHDEAEAKDQRSAGCPSGGREGIAGDKVRSIGIVPQIQAGYGVFVQFEASQNLTNGLTNAGVKFDTEGAYKSIYASPVAQQVRTASMTAWLPLADQFGNTSDQPVFKTILDGRTGRRITWDAVHGLDFAPLWQVAMQSPTF